jgi:hypothetical protein
VDLVNITQQLRDEVQYETHSISRWRHSFFRERIKRSMRGFRLGGRGGRRTASIPTCSSVARNSSENLASRSIMRNFLRRRNPASASLRFLAIWSIQSSSGLAVLPAKYTRRVASSMMKIK